MLELKATGETHPRVFTLTTDDGDAELATMAETFDQWDDGFSAWFRATSADEFAAGVVVPGEFVADGSLGDLVEECDFTQAIEECERVTNEYHAELEAKMEAGE